MPTVDGVNSLVSKRKMNCSKIPTNMNIPKAMSQNTLASCPDSFIDFSLDCRTRNKLIPIRRPLKVTNPHMTTEAYPRLFEIRNNVTKRKNINTVIKPSFKNVGIIILDSLQNKVLSR